MRSVAEDGEAQGAVEDEATTPRPGVRRELEVAARSYRGGLTKLAPRVERLATAARAVIEAGGSASEVRALFAEVGLTPADIPPAVHAALKRPARH